MAFADFCKIYLSIFVLSFYILFQPKKLFFSLIVRYNPGLRATTFQPFTGRTLQDDTSLAEEDFKLDITSAGVNSVQGSDSSNPSAHS